jgi:mRNA interferase YafQ
MRKLRDLILLLLVGDPLPELYRDHPLTGNWKGLPRRARRARLAPDQPRSGDELHLVRTGSHADLFDERGGRVEAASSPLLVEQA